VRGIGDMRVESGIKCSEWIPRERMNQFQRILSDCGGAFLANPIDCGDRFYCYYNPGDYEALSRIFYLLF